MDGSMLEKMIITILRFAASSSPFQRIYSEDSARGSAPL